MIGLRVGELHSTRCTIEYACVKQFMALNAFQGRDPLYRFFEEIHARRTLSIKKSNDSKALKELHNIF